MPIDEDEPIEGTKGEILDAASTDVAGDLVDAETPDEDGLSEPPILERRDSSNRHKRAVFGVPIQVVIAVGRATPSIGELMTMRRDTLLRLDAKIDDPVDLMIGKRVIARGELQELEDEEGRLGVRLTEIVDLAEPF